MKEARAFVRWLLARVPTRSRCQQAGHTDWRTYARGAWSKIPHDDTMPRWFGPFVTWVIVASVLLRGSDLVLLPNEGRSELSTWVNVVGNHAYGWLFMGSGLVLAAAKLASRIGPVIIALAVVAGVNLMYSIALLQGIVLSPGPFTGWRFAASPFLATVLCIGRLISLMRDVRRVS